MYIVYYSLTGFMGGPSQSPSYNGGGSNYLCMPIDPIFEKNAPGSDRARVYGTEYGGVGRIGSNHHNIPCVACQVTEKSLIMIPARDECYEGWNTQYTGYLAAENYETRRSEYVCVDNSPEPSVFSSPLDENGGRLVPAQTRCGSLPCLPYIDYRDLSCVVCTR